LLGLSARQVKRLKRRYADDHVDWVYHGNRGRPPVHRIGTPTRDPVIEWRAASMRVTNDTHLHEKRKETAGAAPCQGVTNWQAPA